MERTGKSATVPVVCLKGRVVLKRLSALSVVHLSLKGVGGA